MTRAEKYLGFDDRRLGLMSVPAITIIISIMIFGTEFFFENPLICVSICFLFTLAYWFSTRQLIIEYHKRFENYTFNIKRLAYVSFWLIVIYFGVKLVVGQFVSFFFGTTNPNHNHIAENISTALMMLLMFFLYEGIYYFNKSRLIEIEKNKLERLSAQQKLDTLKNQVNPHFLFNSLNTLVTIIPEEPKLAVKFVQELSKSYRSILEVRDEKLITIDMELNALRSYIYLLETRFKGKIDILDNIDENIKHHFIIPLSLQILIENAVKHNITSKAKPLKVEIRNTEEHVIVENNLQKKDQQYSSTKLGLANIKSRYQLLADADIEIIEESAVFRVMLPIIKNREDAHIDN